MTDQPNISDNSSSDPGFSPDVPPEKTGFGDMPQSRLAVWSAVIILFLVDSIFLVTSFISGGNFGTELFGMNIPMVSSIFIDFILGIFLLRGKNSVRGWMIARVVLGLLIFGISAFIAKDYAGAVTQAGTSIAIVLLLTGTSTNLRVKGSIALFLVTYIGGIIWMLSPTAPISYSTYENTVADYSFRYPSDWYVFSDDEVAESFEGSNLVPYIEGGILTVTLIQDYSGNGVIFVYLWDDELAGKPVFTDIDEATCIAFTADFTTINFNKVDYSRACTTGGYDNTAEMPGWEIAYLDGIQDEERFSLNGFITRSKSKSCWSYLLVTEKAHDTFLPTFNVVKNSIYLGNRQ